MAHTEQTDSKNRIRAAYAATGEDADRMTALLAENGIRNISIRQLTGEVGIAQGGFYTFYKDKDDFVEDLFLLRIREKTDIFSTSYF